MPARNVAAASSDISCAGRLVFRNGTSRLSSYQVNATHFSRGGSGMSIAHDFSMEHSIMASNGAPVPLGGTQRALHRVAAARHRQGVSVRSAARRLGISIDQVREQEEPTHDLLVSELQAWQRAL